MDLLCIEGINIGEKVKVCLADPNQNFKIGRKIEDSLQKYKRPFYAPMISATAFMDQMSL